MSKSIKQIYVTLQIEDCELKILVAENFNSRFNVLKVCKKQSKAVIDFKINDRELLKTELIDLIDECSNKLGAKIEQVILVLPPYNFKRFPMRSTVIPENGVLNKIDVARAVSNALKTKIDDDVIAVNAMATKYTINGFSTRKMPDNESCNEAIIDIDLLCADANMVVDYVQLMEEINIKVIDICLNTFAIAKEASLFEASATKNIIILDIGKSCTYLSLISKGKLVSTEIVYESLDKIGLYIRNKYNIPMNDIYKLIKYDIDYDSLNKDEIVYAYNESGHTYTISIQDLNNIAFDVLNNIADKFATMCEPIIESGAELFITGEGEEINSLVQMLADKTNTSIRRYCPETIGVRDPNLTSLFGALYAYHDKVILYNLNVNCIDLLEYDSVIDQKQLDAEGDTITTKIKNLFRQYIEKEK